MTVSLAVIILTHNELLHIKRCIRQLDGLASQVFVVDSFSSDGTPEIARDMGAKVLQNKFVNYARQFEWALANAQIDANWVMRLDADEVIEADLADEIRVKLPQLASDVAGVTLKRKHIFLGRWVRHGGRYPLVLLRIWRRDQGRIEDRWMDEHMIVWGGRTIAFQGGFADHNLNDLTFFTDKHNRYATREAVDVLNQEFGLFARDADLSDSGGSRQAATKRILKERVYNRVPFPLAATGYFLHRYVLQRGFLDGIEGLAYHFLQGFWYRFLVGAKVLEFRRILNEVEGPDAKRAQLARLTGLCLNDSNSMGPAAPKG